MRALYRRWASAKVARKPSSLPGPDEVNRIGHEAPGPDLCARGLGGLADQVEIGSVVPVIEEDRLPVIASLGDVVRQAWDNHARKSGHRWSSAG